MRRDRIGPPCRGSGRRTSPSCAPVNPFCHPLRARGPGRGLPAATGSLANAIGRAKTAEGLGRAFSPAFRARAWVPKNLARRVLIYWFRRRDAARPDRAAMPRIGPANLSIVRPPFTPSVTLYAREGQAVVCPLLRGRSPTRSVAPKQPRTGEPLHRAPPVHPFCHPLRARGSGRGLPAATGSLANAIGRAKTAEGLGRAFSPAFRARAWVPKNLARRVLIYWFR